tara:strand:- start:103 stop:798 length:696 start_codon:yes stop_codon:yes gene_type:complete
MFLTVFLAGSMGCDSGGEDSAMETNMVMTGVDPFCDTRPQFYFCEDFDTRTLPGVFDEQILESADMRIDDTESSSAPRSLLVSVSDGGNAVLRHQFGVGGKLRIFGMLHIAELGEGDAEIGAFEVGDYRVGFGVSSDGSLWAYEGGQRIPGAGTIPVGRWASFRWDVNLSNDGTGTASLRFGNDFIVSTDMLTPPVSSELAPAVAIGLFNATGAWAMRFDNLTVEVGELSQ